MDITDVCEECFSCYWFVSNNDEYECSGCEEPCEEYLDMNRKQFEKDILKVIASYNINVDADELVKALRYDRDQYEKGYR